MRDAQTVVQPMGRSSAPSKRGSTVAIDGLNSAIVTGLKIHGIAISSVASDGDSIEIEALTCGQRFVVTIARADVETEGHISIFNGDGSGERHPDLDAVDAIVQRSW